MNVLRNSPNNPAAQPFNITSVNKTKKRGWWHNIVCNKKVKACALPIHGEKK